MNTRYKIHMLSARSLISYATAENNQYTFHLSKRDTRKCIMREAADEQDDNALFYQTMCVLHGSNFEPPQSETALYDLQDVIFYVDFNGIFDRGNSPKMMERQKKAEAMFRPDGITLHFGNGAQRYLAFERSGSMSRQAKLSFIRADVHDEVRRRIMMDMVVGDCQLSKLYAYNGLMFSGGVRIDGINLADSHRVIVVKNETYRAQSKVVSVDGTAVNEAVKKYNRKEELRDITVLRHDGEGLISKELAKTVDNTYCGKHIHHSFQIRMPFVKGMVHEIDFKDFLKSAGSEYITDIWGVRHPVDKVEMILTQSMFKGYGWLTENGMDWKDYLSIFKKYNHALYVTNVSKVKPDDHTELNYQFLNTLSMTAEEFRPHDLPDGWEQSPSTDNRNWITKATEQRYYDFCLNEDFRRQYFINKNNALGKCIKKNPLFVNEKACVKELNDNADKLIRQYSLGRLLVKGDNRFLSDDILDLLTFLIERNGKLIHRQSVFWSRAMTERFNKNSFYSPGASYDADAACTLLRNPHIARNEEIQLKLYGKSSNMRKYYLSQLTDVVMVDPESLAAQRLGGADFDGDMIKTIADNLLNECVKRNYEYDDLNDRSNLPLLYIPSEEPVTRNANDWHERFVTVRDTFSSRVGQICNAAFDRSIIAYDENSNAEERHRCREQTEVLSILTGLEIDSVKSGVKPDLTEYLVKERRAHNLFLKYKSLLELDRNHAWYEDSPQKKIKQFFASTDWDKVTSNVERLPYLAKQLKESTKRLNPKPAKGSELFAFATKPDWKDSLDSNILSSVGFLIQQYEAVLSRIRACRAPIKNKASQNDIDRILYSRGQEDVIDSDALYAEFSKLSPERISLIRSELTNQSWHLMDRDSRLDFLSEFLPEFEDYYYLLADFRFGGYRVFGDLICDIDDENNATERKKLLRSNDSKEFTKMMQAYLNKSHAQSYRQAVAVACKALLDKIIKPKKAVPYVVALGKRDLLWELLPDAVYTHVLGVKKNAE